MIVVDIDGTIADMRHREHLLQAQLDVAECKGMQCPYLIKKTKEPECLRVASCENKKITQAQWDAFLDEKQLMKDGVIPNSREVLFHASLYHEIVFITGRNEATKKATTLWLKDVFGFKQSINLVMRPKKNRDPAEVIKRELLAEIKLAHSDDGLMYAFDDDEVMEAVYKKHGFKWFQAPHCWAVIREIMGLFR